MAEPTQKHKAARKPAPSKRKGRIQRKGRGKKPAYVQTKLAMSTPGDKQEQEADRVADHVSRSPRGAQRQASDEAQRASATPQTEQGEQSVAPVSRQTDESMVATQLMRQEEEAAQTKLYRQEENEEEEALQAKLHRQVEDEEEEAVQAKLHRQVEGEEEEAIQAKLYRQLEEDEEEAAQPKLYREQQEDTAGDTEQEQQDRPEVPPEVEQKIEEQRGNGEPLPESVRAEMEEKIGANFSAAIVHTDGTADELCKALSARAFTVGNDVFFASGEYSPDTEDGRTLLAHELAHVVQQADEASSMLHRSGGGTSTPTGTYNNRGSIIFPTLPVPGDLDFASRHNALTPLIRFKNFTGGRDNSQRTQWRAKVPVANTVKALKTIYEETPGVPKPAPSQSQYNFVVPSGFVSIPKTGIGKGTARFAVGTLDDIARELLIPTWDQSGSPLNEGRGATAGFDVDHIVEQQVGASNATGKSFTAKTGVLNVNNLWLLRPSINQQTKKNAISTAVKTEVNKFIRGNTNEYGSGNKRKPFSDYSASELMGKLSMQFTQASAGTKLGISEKDYWTRSSIEAGAHIDAIKKKKQIRYVSVIDLDQGVKDPNERWLFGRSTGGVKGKFDVANPTAFKGLSPFQVKGMRDSGLQPQELLKLTVNFKTGGHKNKKGTKLYQPFAQDREITVKRIENGAGGYATQLGYFDSKSSEQTQMWNAAKVIPLSPLQVNAPELRPDHGFVLTGQILPTLPFLNGGIDFMVDADDLTFSKTFSTSDLALPSPFSVSDSSLTVSFGTKGFGAAGCVSFEVTKLGEGSLEGKLADDGKLGVVGTFDFDSKLFDPAQVKLSYIDDALIGEGTVGIPKGKVPGINKATIKAHITKSSITASGDAELDIPGVEKGSLNLSYSEKAGFAIGGTFNLSSDIPGIKSGSLSASLKEKPNGEGYAVKASGTAVPDVPGFDSTLAVEYDEGAITLSAEATYKKGMLDGKVKAGATNRTLDEAGNPTGKPGEEIIFYGGGELGLKVAPWLKATVGVNFLPNADIEVKGEVGLPSSIEIFSRKELKKDIFSINIPIPIVPGIFAKIGGGLGASAGIGPGKIDELKLGIKYNPNDEANTHVYGSAHLNIPADAGLRLSVSGSIGLGIPAVSVSGGLEVGGTLGIAGAAEAGVQIDWKPSTGLEINAQGKLSAQPKFKFDITGFVKAEALWFTVYEKRWQLATFEYGSDMTFGVKFPVRYKEGEPFDISLSDVEFETPKIDTGSLLKGLVKKIA